MINKGNNHAVKVNSPFESSVARLTMTATSKDERSKDYGVINLDDEIQMPKMSIATITFEDNGEAQSVKQNTSDSLESPTTSIEGAVRTGTLPNLVTS